MALSNPNLMRLGINIDHVATLRQARGGSAPDPLQAAQIALSAGADEITVHLREDRRHIQESDLCALIKQLTTEPINLEMAATQALLKIATQYQPSKVCLVPEKRAELTTEGGLDVVAHEAQLQPFCQRLSDHNIQVSLFIDPVDEQLDAALRCGVPAIEIHTGYYANVANSESKKVVFALESIQYIASRAHQAGLIVHAGHGLDYDNVQAIAMIPEISTLNIGHAIIARALFDGLSAAVYKMHSQILSARHHLKAAPQIAEHTPPMEPPI